MRTDVLGMGCAAWLMACTSLVTGQVSPPQPIPGEEIASLQDELLQAGRQDDSPVALRREIRALVRKGLGLVDSAPAAPNRFLVLAAVLEGQKRLVAIDNSEPNRALLFDICEKLAGAPDEHAKERLEADLLLSERTLSEKNATRSERAKALDELIKRYQGTVAEAKSLLMGALIVQKLDVPELEESMLGTLDERFSDDPEVIEFRRKYLRAEQFVMTFSGTYERLDGKVLSFPVDALGHLSLMVFWSKDQPGISNHLARVDKELALYPGRINVFSFNVDELPDAGESVLRQHRLAWTVMRLPGGRQNPACRGYAKGVFSAILVNECGQSVIREDPVQGSGPVLDPYRISEVRYSAHLQSVFIGDLLLPESENGPVSRLGPVEGELAREIQECFVLAPLRYRLSREAALANYRKAEGLCREAALRHAAAPEGWQLRNRRMIALLGIWNLSLSPDALEQAVEEAKASLAGTLPVGAEVVPRFVLAKAAIRRNPDDTGALVSQFVTECGGETNAQVLAAAIILSLDARSREHYDSARNTFLALYGESPSHYALSAFLRDRYLQYRLLKPNYARKENPSRGYIISFPGQLVRPLPTVELKRVDGSVFVLPREMRGKATYLLFIEPPADPASDFPVIMDVKGNPTRNDRIRSMVDYATSLAMNNPDADVQVVAAFLTDDADQVKRLMATNRWSCTPVLVPGGRKSPIVRQLGVLSADTLPNVYVLRRDGVVIWQVSGYLYQSDFGYPYAAMVAMRIQMVASEFEFAVKSLEAGAFKDALRLFRGPFKPPIIDAGDGLAPRFHGQALALMGLKDWAGALEAIDNALTAHKLKHSNLGRQRFDSWQDEAAAVVVREPCDVFRWMWATKAVILDQLGRTADAREVRKLAGNRAKADHPSLSHTHHKRLAVLETDMRREKKLP